MLHQSEVLQYIGASHNMGFHLRIFLIGKTAYLVQHTVRDAYLSYIVQLRSLSEIGYVFVFRKSLKDMHLLCYQSRILCHTL